MTYNAAEIVLFALSALGEGSWAKAKSLVDDAHAHTTTRPTADRHDRWRLIAELQRLGHIDLVADRGSVERVCAAPAVLARLPTPGTPVAVICGRRAPETTDAVRTVAAKIPDVAVTETHQHDAPARIAVSATTVADLAAVAQRLGIVFTGGPAAWNVVNYSGDLMGMSLTSCGAYAPSRTGKGSTLIRTSCDSCRQSGRRQLGG